MIAAMRFGDANAWVRQVAGVAAVILVIGGIELEREGRLRIPQALQVLGDASYSIYLVHMPLLIIMVKPLFRMSEKSQPSHRNSQWLSCFFLRQ
jgi:peptidoglycan/LPS O-acetylase OafA/YrhL